MADLPKLPPVPRLPERAAIYIATDGTVHFGALFEGLLPVARALGILRGHDENTPKACHRVPTEVTDANTDENTPKACHRVPTEVTDANTDENTPKACHRVPSEVTGANTNTNADAK